MFVDGKKESKTGSEDLSRRSRQERQVRLRYKQTHSAQFGKRTSQLFLPGKGKR
jgi:hypothetical protein